MLGTVGVVASPFLARAALVGATAAWIALWCVAFVSAARGARSADPEAGVAAVAPIRRAYFKGLLVVLTLASLATWAIAVRERVMEVFRVPSPSMEPAIVPGTRVLVDKLAYRSGPVRRGDVVVFVNPNERWQSYSVAGTRGGAHTQRFVLSTRRQSSSVEGQPRSRARSLGGHRRQGCVDVVTCRLQSMIRSRAHDLVEPHSKFSCTRCGRRTRAPRRRTRPSPGGSGSASRGPDWWVPGPRPGCVARWSKRPMECYRGVRSIISAARAFSGLTKSHVATP
jgi:hypothetical protein